ncbi:hypothetical protein ASZ90_014495 [hydrocarbon metagenome]|uniref:Uncharacterized protein n=1 Tax=hydrocarbon metagenome TaxID=938273 RepID=A0A0W8F4U8_9ZZZZ
MKGPGIKGQGMMPGIGRLRWRCSGSARPRSQLRILRDLARLPGRGILEVYIRSSSWWQRGS